MTQPGSLISRLSTAHVDPADRVAAWEEYNRRALVGLKCSPYAEQGLLATQTNVRFGALRMADIAGNEHVVERTSAACRALPKDSVFASLVLSGEAVFYHGQGCLTLGAGELVMYDTRRSYLFGFSAPMRQLLVDIPRELFAEVPSPIRFGVDSPGLGSLRTLLEGIAARPESVSDGTDDLALDLLRALATGGAAPLFAAKDFIDRHLGDHELTPARVAAAVGMSVRHLGRLFAAEGDTPARYVQRRRLARARRELADPTSRHRTIAGIAHRWGFASHAHFTRVFRAEFGHPPADLR
ncbi:helix-turn-helix domain-containing protein [Saccharopolyspora sp. WRP15-2]|uniref:Helix-turn-helix domain-containing protein n=1 Tax=Saccharopolyspora oryzae TaxID=2997343 RepID=A0ABT4V9X3_9PSEU|nr:helix-turn-helix domain-containing protein [Saccharopolyspora oryzae]MDA3630754.1 helix-turn-helix domain-containing protein [Saccharopolyspora oryzae]